MWKKSEDPRPTPVSSQAPPTAAQRTDGQSVAMIGPSIVIKGDLSGQEDLLVQGRVEGQITLRQNSVTVGQNGRVKADIHGKTIRVDGEVQGNLYGTHEIVIRASGRVHGNLVSPRVTLENGSKFRGSIDMEAASSKSQNTKVIEAAAAGKPAAKVAEQPTQQPAATAGPSPART